MSLKYRRHPAHVTADRLKGHYENYYSILDSHERDYFSVVIQALEEIGDGSRRD